MAKVLKKLQNLDFPECSRQALQYIASCYTSPHGASIPGLSSGGDNYALEVSQEFILYNNPAKRVYQKKLSALQELHLLEMLCSCLQDVPQGSRYSIFSLIFGGIIDEKKMNLLAKLVSMALSVGVGAVLDCTALWMQEQDCHSKPVCDLSHRLVEDYILLFPDVSQTFHKLPSVSPLFTCNFVTAVTTIFPFEDVRTIPPLSLLEYITDWISNDPCLCSESVRLVRIQANFSCPFSGLVQWCVLGPLVYHISETSLGSNKTDVESSRVLLLLSRLHFSLLQSLQAYKSMELNQILFLSSQFEMLSNSLMLIYQNSPRQYDQDMLQVLVERIGQVIQVAMVTNSLKKEKGHSLQTICQILPQNRLLNIISKHDTGHTAQPMDVS